MIKQAIEKIESEHAHQTKEYHIMQDKIFELDTSQKSIIASIEHEFAIKKSKIYETYPLPNYTVITECYDLIKSISEYEYVALPSIPNWLSMLINTAQVPTEFASIWSLEEYQTMKTYFTDLITNAKHIKATSRAIGTKTGYKAEDTILEPDEDMWDYMELIDETQCINMSNCNCFTTDTWIQAFTSACEHISHDAWDYDYKSEYVRATVSIPIIVLCTKS